MPPFSKRSLISSAKRLFVLSIRFLHLSEKGQSLTARDPLVRERCKLSTSASASVDFRNCFPAKRALRPGVIFASFASADALRRLASYSLFPTPYLLPPTTARPALATFSPSFSLPKVVCFHTSFFQDLVISYGQYNCRCKQ